MKRSRAKKPSRKKRLNYGRLPVLLFVLFLAYLVIVAGGQLRQLWVMKRTLAQAEEELKTLKAHNQQLWEKVQVLQNPGALEQLARQRLGMVKPGEVPVLNSSPPSQGPNQAAPKE
ncbi:FtsB family cell division protein [Desulfothermobacter acidiphilus]|uniref:FtsB family cell division protein n=1 Tax=Desulfothermobacter acidiphilus TaxID=1938353 RepID=UPI003F8C53FF